MTEFEVKDIHKISNILNGVSPQGEKLEDTVNYETPRYLIVLYCALKFPIWKSQIRKEDRKLGLTLPTLKKIAKILSLDFDRTRSSGRIYEVEESENRVKISTIDNFTCYRLSPKGLVYCRKIIEDFTNLVELMENKKESEQFTQKALDRYTATMDKLDKMTPEEKNKWITKPENQGKIFRQPTKNESRISLILKKYRFSAFT